MGFEKMEPIFGELKAECPGLPETVHLRHFLFLLRCLPNEPSTLSFQVTNFHSDTWEALKTRSQLEDMRDGIGIGGSWSDFVEYFIASIKSEDIKLVMDGQSVSGEEERRSELTNLVSAEQEKNETLRRQLDTMLYSKKQKVQRINDKTISETSKDSPDKEAVQNPASTKASKRVVPAYRRVKVRGVLLQDTEDDPQD